MAIDTLQKIFDSGVKLTPMMAQYFEIKKKYPNTLLFFRMGDFYELFFEDAQEAAKLLNITLTHRGKLGEVPIPMAGIPHHSAATYVDRITTQGMKVAICEQVEDPKTSPGIVRREVTQVASPGMPFDLEKMDPTEHRFLSCAACYEGHYFLVLLDFTTGDFLGLRLENEKELLDQLQLHSPKELITFMGQWEEQRELKQYLQLQKVVVTHLSAEYFTLENGEIYIERLIPSFKRDEIIRLNQGVLSPIAALAYYICSTQLINSFYHIRPFRMESEKGKMRVTLSTLTGLEIYPRHKSTIGQSLLGIMDKTKTCMGARELRTLFLHPTASLTEISQRHLILDFFIKRQELLHQLRERLSEVRDLERILAKVSTKKVTAQDLWNLAAGIFIFQEIAQKLSPTPIRFLNTMKESQLQTLLEVAKKIQKTLSDEVGATLDKGNLIKAGVSAERDRLYNLGHDSVQEIVKLEAKYRQQTQIPNLKIKYNNISGHFIEISKSHLSKVPARFERRQTLVNSERYSTKELVEFEKEVVTAQDRLRNLEREIFEEVLQQVISQHQLILKLSHIFGLIDTYQGLAFVAVQENFVRPIIEPEQKILHLKGAWHPLVKSVIRDEFVTHDLLLNEEKFFGLVTGPNMAGKTTVMREVAIIQFLAQIGSFVPATFAKLSLCHYLFSRLGASDDIMKGQSTFMVEMSESSEILRHANERSLIILDEVGRGTSTYDGLSIAWAMVEHLVKKTKAITLFSTHYHELIQVVADLEGAKNLSVETTVNKGHVHFLYRLLEKGTAQSYGLYVAKLAGLPRSVLKRAEKILHDLEKDQRVHANTNSNANDLVPLPNLKNTTRRPDHKYEKVERGQEVQLCFFAMDDECYRSKSTNSYESESREESTLEAIDLELIPEKEWIQEKEAPNAFSEHFKNIEEALNKIDIMNITPLQAMEHLYHLKKNLTLQ